MACGTDGLDTSQHAVTFNANQPLNLLLQGGSEAGKKMSDYFSRNKGCSFSSALSGHT